MNRYLNHINQGMGSQSMPQQLDNPYLQQLQQRLAEAQQMQKQLYQTPNSFTQPMQTEQTQQPQISAEGQAVLALFEDFAKTEEGKQLVSLMGKFNSFCQSKVAKAENKE